MRVLVLKRRRVSNSRVKVVKFAAVDEEKDFVENVLAIGVNL